MKKSLLFMALMLAFSASGLNANAQIGIDFGYMGSSYRSVNKGTDNVTTSDPLNGFYLGVTDDIRLVAGLSIQPGLSYSFLTSSEKQEVAGFKLSGSTNEHNLNIPVHIKYTFDILPVLGIYVFGGPSFNIGLASNECFNISGSLLGTEIDGKLSYDNYTGKIKSKNLSEDIQNKINDYMPQSRMTRFDVLLGGGLGVNLFKFLTVRGGYDYGMINRYKGENKEQFKVNRSQFYVSVGFRF